MGKLTDKVSMQMEICRDALKKEIRNLEETIHNLEWELRAKEACLEYNKEALEELEEFISNERE